MLSYPNTALDSSKNQTLHQRQKRKELHSLGYYAASGGDLFLRNDPEERSSVLLRGGSLK
jgi:hypothetical protein